MQRIMAAPVPRLRYGSLTRFGRMAASRSRSRTRVSSLAARLRTGFGPAADASGRRAHHRRSVDGCRCRTDFFRAACFNATATEESTSARRLQTRGSPSPPQGRPQLLQVPTAFLFRPAENA